MATPNLAAMSPVERTIFRHSMAWHIELSMFDSRMVRKELLPPHYLRTWQQPVSLFPKIISTRSYDKDAGDQIMLNIIEKNPAETIGAMNERRREPL